MNAPFQYGTLATKENFVDRVEDRAFASQVCDVVECHSWYIQQLCYFIWNATTEEVTEQTFLYGLRQLLVLKGILTGNETVIDRY